MKDRHVLDELSAYIDGEATHPERIERHLSQCPDCARRHMQLLRLSSHLGALEEPDVAPAFLTRVMAHVRETEMLPARRAWYGLPQLIAVLVLVAVGGGLLYGVGPLNEPSGEPIPQHAAVEPETDYLDDEAVIEAMAELMDKGVDLTYVASDTPTGWLMEEDDITYDEVVALLAEEVSGESNTVYPGDSDVYGLIDGLEDTEAEAFESLLTDYMGKG